MSSIDALIDAAALAAVEHTYPGEPSDHDDGDYRTTFSWPHLVARLTEAGEIDLAAKTALAALQAGRSVPLSPEVEKRVRKMQAQNKAETFRQLNEVNATNFPLPAWIRNELGVTY